MTGKHLRVTVAWTCVLALAAGSFAVPALAHDKTLYERLGGYDAVAAVVDDFLVRLTSDPEFERFFTGHSEHSLARIRQQLVEQVCEVAGGPCVYTGRDMKTSHRGLGITKAHWETMVKHLVASLDKFKVGDPEKHDLLTALATLEGDIVEKH